MAKLKKLPKVLTGDQAIRDYKEVYSYVGIMLSVHIGLCQTTARSSLTKLIKNLTERGFATTLFC